MQPLTDAAGKEAATRPVQGGSPGLPLLFHPAIGRSGARELDFRRIITYTLATEPGTSLRAAGWVCAGPAGGGTWDTPSRRREDAHPTGPKVRWEVVFGGAGHLSGGRPVPPSAPSLP